MQTSSESQIGLVNVILLSISGILIISLLAWLLFASSRASRITKVIVAIVALLLLAVSVVYGVNTRMDSSESSIDSETPVSTNGPFEEGLDTEEDGDNNDSDSSNKKKKKNKTSDSDVYFFGFGTLAAAEENGDNNSEQKTSGGGNNNSGGNNGGGGGSDPPDEPYSFTDDFERADSATLGNGWTDCKDDAPDSYEPIGIYDGGVVVSDPETRNVGTYDTTPPTSHPPPPGFIHPGIGCAYRETGASTFSVSAVWSGNHTSVGSPDDHVEGTPLVYITPGTPLRGFGAWPSTVFGFPIVWGGYIGDPPEDFSSPNAGPFPVAHAEGETIEIEIRAEQKGEVTVWFNGVQVNFNVGGFGLNPIEVDPSLTDSTKHGLAIDSHFVDPRENIPTTKGLESIQITEL